jgi:hypothetical protein
MARRRVPPPNFTESLLDIMANVVGILIIVAALTQLSIGARYGEILQITRAEVRDVPAPRVAEAREESARVKKGLGERLKGWKPLKDDVPFRADDLAGLTKALPRLKAVQEEIALALKAVEEERARLDKRPPPAVVHVPDPQLPPRGLKPEVFMCRNGRVYPFGQALADRIANELAELFPDFAKLKDVGPEDLAKVLEDRASWDRLIEHFREKDVGDRWLRVVAEKVEQQGKLPARVILRMAPRNPGQGESLADLAGGKSAYEMALEGMRREGHYVIYHVWEDPTGLTFAAFVEARRRAEQRGLRTGWGIVLQNLDYRIDPRGSSAGKID